MNLRFLHINCVAYVIYKFTNYVEVGPFYTQYKKSKYQLAFLIELFKGVGLGLEMLADYLPFALLIK